MRKSIAVALTTFVVAACGHVPESGPRAGDAILFIAGRSAVTAVDARTHAEVASLPPGVASPDWQHYFSVSGNRLFDLDPMTGQTVRSLPLPETYLLPIVTSSGLPGGPSPDGRWLALQAPGTSHLLVVDTSFAQAPRRIDLDGDFTFDAISNDGMRVYLIQHAAGGHYFVRDYVFGVGLDPNIVFDKSDGGVAMSGVRLMGVPSPDGSWLYSVYARKDESAFVHELNLDATVAVCVDLAGPGYAADAKAMQWSLAMSGASGTLFAVNGPLGLVMQVDSARSATIGAMRGGTSALVSFDGRALLIGGAGVRWLDTSTLRVSATALTSWAITGLAMPADGRGIYALSDSGKVAAVDSAGHVASTFDSGVAQPIALLSVQRFS